MAKKIESQLNDYEYLLHTEINATLEKGGLVAAILGVLAGIAIWLMGHWKIMPYYELPAIWGSSCGLYGLFIYYMAKQKLIKGFFQYVIVFVMISFRPLHMLSVTLSCLLAQQRI